MRVNRWKQNDKEGALDSLKEDCGSMEKVLRNPQNVDSFTSTH